MHNRDLSQVFQNTHNLRIMVVGDVMVDAYLFGKVDRISPEAPVPIVSVDRRVNRLGGAANVALNLKAIGATPVLCSVIGQDQKGEEFLQLLGESGIAKDCILQSSRRVTTTKFRVIGNNAQMLRVDEETTQDLDAVEQESLLSTINAQLADGKVDALIFQDYNKGVLTEKLIASVIAAAVGHGVPVAVDPKKRNFSAYRGVTLFKPNLKELKEGLNIEVDPGKEGMLESAANMLHREQEVKMVMVTLSDKGVFISDHGEKYCTHTLPAHRRSIADVSGAGDSVISVAAVCLASGMTPWEIAYVSNIAGGLVCEEVGVVPVDREKLIKEIQRLSEA